MTKSAIQELIWDLRNQQANCTPSERAEIQREIERLYRLLDSIQA